jgi:hypothetical protein
VADISVEDFLAHHGVKGMKWGVRKDRNTGGLSPKQGEDGVRPLAKKLDESWFGRLSKANMERYNRKVVNKRIKKAMKDRHSKAGSDSDAGPALALLALYGGVAVTAIGVQKVKMYRDSGRKDAKKTGIKEFKKNPSLTKKMTVTQLHSKVVKPINPDYGKPGTKMNCRRATMAYEMRRRGYDVKATESHYASGQTIKGLKNAAAIDKKEKFQSDWGEKKVSNDATFLTSAPRKKAELVFESLSHEPNGSRGEVGVQWTMGGGHSMAYEVVNHKPIIFDTQSGKIYDTPQKFTEFTPVVLQAAHTRLDNRPIDPVFIKRWVTDAA